MIELINTANAQALRKGDALLASLYADQDRRLLREWLERTEEQRQRFDGERLCRLHNKVVERDNDGSPMP